MNYQHRYESFQSLRTLDFETQVAASAEGHAITPLSRTELSSVCEVESELSALVLTQAVLVLRSGPGCRPSNSSYAKKVDGKLEGVHDGYVSHLFLCRSPMMRKQTT